MKYIKYLIGILVTTSLISLLFPSHAYAYLDPGTGSYIFQILIAVAVGGLFAIKLFWGKIKAFFNKSSSDENDDETAEK